MLTVATWTFSAPMGATEAFQGAGKRYEIPGACTLPPFTITSEAASSESHAQQRVRERFQTCIGLFVCTGHSDSQHKLRRGDTGHQAILNLVH